MKLFWIAIALLACFTAVLLLAPSGGATPNPQALEANLEAPAPRPATDPEPSPETPAPTLSESIPPAEEPVPETGPVGANAPAPGEIDQIESELAQTGDAAPETTTEDAEPGTPSAATANASEAPASDPDAVFQNTVRVKRVVQDDGTVLLDDRFTIRGAGTESEPYEISWELLLSASETYQPRRGKKRLPERVTMLHNKHVRVTGYVAFPIVATSQDEMLSMRNMWDGCCIGLPPTAYDAIEVRLDEPATGDDRFAAYGTVEGRFLVDPYLKGDWLLGLYMMENATLRPSGDMQRDPSQHAGNGGAFPGMP